MTDGWVNTSFRYANSTRKLHLDESCQYVTPESTPIEDARVDPDELDVCSWCDGSVERTQSQQQECAFCGDTVKNLPDHLPCEASP